MKSCMIAVVLSAFLLGLYACAVYFFYSHDRPPAQRVIGCDQGNPWCGK